MATTPGRKFFDEHMALIGAGKLDEMIDTQYSADVLHISPWDIIPGTRPPHILRGRDELKKFFHIYMKAQGSINIESLYDFAETDNSISVQLELKGLSQRVTSPDELLDRGILGYRTIARAY